MNKEYNTQIYSGLSAFLTFFTILVLLLAIIFGIAIISSSTIVVAVGFALLIIVPYFFQKKFLQLFTKDVILMFDYQSFSVRPTNNMSDRQLKERVFKWEELKAYKFYFTPSKKTVLDIYMKDGTHKEFAFKDNKTQKEAITQENASIFNIFHSFIKAYNLTKSSNEIIALKPGFLTTKRGTYCLWFVGFLMLVAIAFLIITNAKSFPFLFIGIFIFLPLLAKRRQDKVLYELVNSL